MHQHKHAQNHLKSINGYSVTHTLSSRFFANDYHKKIIYLGLIFFFLIGLATAGTTETFNRFIDVNPEKPWHITANEINYDHNARQYIAIGNVIIIKDDKKLTADTVRFNHITMDVLAEGLVTVTAGKDILKGNKIAMNLEQETGTIYNGSIFLEESHFNIKGNRIQKLGEHVYTIDKADITTCDGYPPAWRITGRNLKVTLEGYGHLNHATLWVKNVPVLYTPFLFFPVKLKRQSGLLSPQMAYSDRKGAEYIQPFYWVIDESSDATFFEHYMQRRGNKIGLEYRYVLDDRSKGTLMFDFLNDPHVDDGESDSSEKWGYADDDELRPNSDRYWFRMKHNQSLPFGFSAKLDIDVVSDQDYLSEFRDGYTGFNETNKYFIKNFDRALDPYDDSVRVNRFNLNKIGTNYSLNAEVRWYDDVINRRLKETDDTLQKLPFIEFNTLRQPILKTHFYFDIDSEYSYFYREDGTRGHRFDAYPRLYLPYRFKNYFTFEPSFGLRETAWLIDQYDSDANQDNDWDEKEKTFYRNIYDLSLDISSKIFNVYGESDGGINPIKHIIRPQLIYGYIPKRKQEKYPSFDSIDTIVQKNLLTYSITNTLTLKSENKNSRLTKTKDKSTYTYNTFCRFKLEQSFDFNEENETNPDLFKNQKTHQQEPFSPIFGEVDFIWNDFFSMQADAEWSLYEKKFLSHNVALSLSDQSGDKIFVEHRFIRESTTLDPSTGYVDIRDSSESLYADLIINISDRLSVYSEYERNIKDGKTIKFGLGFDYTEQCWSMGLRYEDEADDQKIALMFQLYGLGQLGKNYTGRSINSLLDNY
ncbi:MAG: LPS-assembly protein LptD [Desulfobacterales bacterium]|nr:LPS-assembly protein LptD [Desulfobacterales bacterium]